MDLKKLFKTVVEKDASEIFFKVGYPPYLRLLGEITPIDAEKSISSQDMEEIIKSILTPEQINIFRERKEVDFALDLPDIGRFRGILALDRQSPSLVFRNVRRKIPSFAELGLPPKIMEKLSLERRGLVLLSGSTGSGKSTTIASMIEYINQHAHKHILTIEDPIEFLFENKKSVITQREIGADCLSYMDALRESTYQSPDVIFIGTIRDRDTMHAAIMAAETGQLLLSTIHSINAPQTVERIINLFPPHQHDEIRMHLSLLLKGIISQRLIPRSDTQGRIPALEIMVGTPTISSLIRENKIHQLNQYIESGAFFGMQTFYQSLARLYFAKKISLETAREFADNPKELELYIQGIKKLDGTVE
ncbi:MAG: PilT/PilU family type 4a pilus ATPase [Candidatus Omnitrophica bacterium]|nr:PilT/PilU family type 4a pilus ATPase [Candidatus Omnitrophota bacterium]